MSSVDLKAVVPVTPAPVSSPSISVLVGRFQAHFVKFVQPLAQAMHRSPVIALASFGSVFYLADKVATSLTNKIFEKDLMGQDFIVPLGVLAASEYWARTTAYRLNNSQRLLIVIGSLTWHLFQHLKQETARTKVLEQIVSQENARCIMLEEEKINLKVKAAPVLNLEEREKTAQRLEEELAARQKQLEDESQKFYQKKKQLESDLHQFGIENENFNKSWNQYRSDFTNYETEKNQLEERQAQLNKDLEALERDKVALEKEKKSLENESREVTEKRAGLKVDREQLEESRKNLGTQIENLNKDRTVLTEEQESFKEAKAAFDAEKGNIQQDLQTAENNAKRYEASLIQLENKTKDTIRNFEAEIDTHLRRIEELKKRIQELEANDIDAQNALNTYKQRSNQLKEENEKLRAELQQLKNPALAISGENTVLNVKVSAGTVDKKD